MPNDTRELPEVLPALLLMSIVHALGEGAGYLLGAGQAGLTAHQPNQCHAIDALEQALIASNCHKT